MIGPPWPSRVVTYPRSILRRAYLQHLILGKRDAAASVPFNYSSPVTAFRFVGCPLDAPDGLGVRGVAGTAGTILKPPVSVTTAGCGPDEPTKRSVRRFSEQSTPSERWPGYEGSTSQMMDWSALVKKEGMK